ncbi:hypothetical protein KEM52_006598 [Ascosphaera acerosa]|nr:hypothetical protein KEM52_006598 [Ascosphaera acerosa]
MLVDGQLLLREAGADGGAVASEIGAQMRNNRDDTDNNNNDVDGDDSAASKGDETETDTETGPGTGPETETETEDAGRDETTGLTSEAASDGDPALIPLGHWALGHRARRAIRDISTGSARERLKQCDGDGDG